MSYEAFDPESIKGSETELGSPPEKRVATFQKGKSGNPAGRPKGAKNKSTIVKELVQQKAEGTLLRWAPKIIEVVAEQAINGCRQSQKLVWNAVIPSKKAIEVTGKDGSDPVFKIIVKSIDTGKEVEFDEPVDGEYTEIED